MNWHIDRGAGAGSGDGAGAHAGLGAGAQTDTAGRPRDFNAPYEGRNLDHIAFPIGGIGAGMFTLQGTGSLGNFSLKNKPDINNDPNIFAALHLKNSNGGITVVLEGQVPKNRIFMATGGNGHSHGLGQPGRNYGLPRYAGCSFDARFPFATVSLEDGQIPVTAKIEGFSPFIPGNSFDSSLPFGSVSYSLSNTSGRRQDGVFYFNALNNFLEAGARAKPIENGFSFYAGSLSFSVFAAEAARVDTAWFRGGWFDSFTMLCNRMGRGISENRARAGDGESTGATLSIPFSLAPGERREIRLFLSWYAPESDLRLGHEFEDGAESAVEGGAENGAEGGAESDGKNSAENGAENGAENNTESDGKNSAENGAESGGENGAENGAGSNAESGAENGDASSNETCRRDTCRRETYRPWYSGQFAGADALNRYIKSEFGRLRSESMAFSDCLFSSTLPPEILEAVAANLSILKSPTVLRQTDGRIWGWEGCQDDYGSCHGSCTHVWNYAQALCSLFPDLERGLRQTEFWDSQNDEGHQAFRASLPIGGADHSFHAAADGQLGGVIKAYREWRISGDSGWMAGIWPRVRQSLEYCISLWDPKESGALTERHHNTYDIEFYGADIMCTGFYLGALLAAAKMAESLQDPAGERYLRLYVKGRKYAEEKLFNGEYFIQLADLDGLERKPAPDGEHPEAAELFRREGPKYQYGAGCLSDGAVGAWLAKLSGLGDILDSAKLESHLMSVYRHNLKKSLARHTNPQRPGYAMGDEGGLLLCTWPNGGKPSLPFVYSDEVWTGIEYEVASHLIMAGRAEEGLEIVRICRSRYDGTARNPFNEYECGHWYARAMSSYALLRAYSGVFYDAAEKTLRVNPAAKGDFQCFFATDGGYGMAGVKDGAAFAQVKAGKIEIARIALGE